LGEAAITEIKLERAAALRLGILLPRQAQSDHP
jgi:hypothetical protein